MTSLISRAKTVAFQGEPGAYANLAARDCLPHATAVPRPTFEDAIAAVREALKGEDVDAIKRAYDDLQNKFQSVTEDLYKQAAANAQSAGAGPGPQAGPQPGPGAGHPGAHAGGGEGQGKGDVVDAEFEVVDEDKKK